MKFILGGRKFIATAAVAAKLPVAALLGWDVPHLMNLVKPPPPAALATVTRQMEKLEGHPSLSTQIAAARGCGYARLTSTGFSSFKLLYGRQVRGPWTFSKNPGKPAPKAPREHHIIPTPDAGASFQTEGSCCSKLNTHRRHGMTSMPDHVDFMLVIKLWSSFQPQPKNS